jgi:hypothetical protein
MQDAWTVDTVLVARPACVPHEREVGVFQAPVASGPARLMHNAMLSSGGPGRWRVWLGREEAAGTQHRGSCEAGAGLGRHCG